MAKVRSVKIQNSKEQYWTTLGCTVMAKPQDNKIGGQLTTTLGCTVMAKPQDNKIGGQLTTTLGCTVM